MCRLPKWILTTWYYNLFNATKFFLLLLQKNKWKVFIHLRAGQPGNCEFFLHRHKKAFMQFSLTP